VKEGIYMEKQDLQKKIETNEQNLERLVQKKQNLSFQIENLEHKIKNQKNALSILK
jgi:phage shock protein A